MGKYENAKFPVRRKARKEWTFCNEMREFPRSLFLPINLKTILEYVRVQ
jgi:hypothetical protein